MTSSSKSRHCGECWYFPRDCRGRGAYNTDTAVGKIVTSEGKIIMANCAHFVLTRDAPEKFSINKTHIGGI